MLPFTRHYFIPFLKGLSGGCFPSARMQPWPGGWVPNGFWRALAPLQFDLFQEEVCPKIRVSEVSGFSVSGSFALITAVESSSLQIPFTCQSLEVAL